MSLGEHSKVEETVAVSFTDISLTDKMDCCVTRTVPDTPTLKEARND